MARMSTADQADALLDEYAFLQGCLVGLQLRAEDIAARDEVGQRAERDAVARQWRRHVGSLSDADLRTADTQLNALLEMVPATDPRIDILQERLDILLEERDERRHDREDPSAQPRRRRPVMVSRY